MHSPRTEQRFFTILRQTHTRVRAFLAGLGVPSSDVDHLAEAAYLELWHDLNRMPAHIAPERWVQGIAKNLCLDYFRRMARDGQSQREPLAELLADTTTRTERLTEDEDLGEVLEDCLSKLPPQRRELVDLRYSQQLDAAEIAAAVDSTTENVHRALHRTRAGLKDCVAQKLARVP